MQYTWKHRRDKSLNYKHKCKSEMLSIWSFVLGKTIATTPTMHWGKHQLHPYFKKHRTTTLRESAGFDPARKQFQERINTDTVSVLVSSTAFSDVYILNLGRGWCGSGGGEKWKMTSKQLPQLSPNFFWCIPVTSSCLIDVLLDKRLVPKRHSSFHFLTTKHF